MYIIYNMICVWVRCSFEDERSEGEEFIRWKIVLEYILFEDETTKNTQAKIDEDV